MSGRSSVHSLRSALAGRRGAIVAAASMASLLLSPGGAVAASGTGSRGINHEINECSASSATGTRPVASGATAQRSAHTTASSVASVAPAGGSPEMVEDINPAGPSRPRNLVDVAGTLFFAVKDASHGFELWKSDGTQPGTKLVKDIRPGSKGSFPSALANVDGTLYFSATDGVHGYELWKSDGTSAGTKLVKDIRIGGSSEPMGLAALGGKVYFSAIDAQHGRELFVSDGTRAGTRLLKDINPIDGSYPAELTRIGTILYFSADDGTHGAELWRTDGTSAGTKRIPDHLNVPIPNPQELTRVGGMLYFRTVRGNCGIESGLGRSDGTSAGTVEFTDVDGVLLKAFHGKLYFVGFGAQGNTRLWSTDGTSGGTQPVIPKVSVQDLYVIGNSLYLTRGSGTGLWKSDGTAAGTVLLHDATGGWLFEGSPVKIGTDIFFSAGYYDEVVGYDLELWKTDGTLDGTQPVGQIATGVSAAPSELTSVGGALFFGANDGIHGDELWRYVP